MVGFSADVKKENPLEKLKADFPLAFVEEKYAIWDSHKGEAVDVAKTFKGSYYKRHNKYARRIEECAFGVELGWDETLEKTKLERVYFCHVRWCPVCAWRRSLEWKARLFQVLPEIKKDYPTASWLFLTLTIRNVDSLKLRQTFEEMGKGWQRMTQRNAYPAIGHIRAAEVTHSESEAGDSHPHYHALLLVEHGYFQSKDYLEHKDWIKLWRQCMRLDYDPSVRIMKVRPDEVRDRFTEKTMDKAIAETLKYALKPADMLAFPTWFLQITHQLRATKSVNVGGVLRDYLRKEKEEAQDEPTDIEEIETPAERKKWFFTWRELARQYRLWAACSAEPAEAAEPDRQIRLL